MWGKSLSTSSAPRSISSSKLSLSTSCGRASGRSILLMTTIGCRLALERLGQHEPRLRHRPFGRVDQHQRAVGHPQHALDLAAEIGVAGRVDEVDLHALVVDGDVLGQDRDAPLALQVVGVEDAVADELAGAELAALAQQAIDQRRLAVVDVGDDGDIADVGATHFGGPGGREGGNSRHRAGHGWRVQAGGGKDPLIYHDSPRTGTAEFRASCVLNGRKFNAGKA